jgi:DNA-directed RNA polymerase subunit omega
MSSRPSGNDALSSSGSADPLPYGVSRILGILAMQGGIDVNSKDLAQRAESLIRHSSNRYLTTVRIAFRAKQRRFDDFDGLLEDSMIKPVQRAIIELSDEQDQPALLPG